MFTYNSIVSFSDSDPAGILFFGNYFKLAHFAYENLLTENGMYLKLFNSQNFIVPLVNSNANYYSSLRSGEKFIIDLIVENIGKSSFTLCFNFYSSQKIKSAEIKTTHVFVSKKTGKKILIPKEFKIFLQKFVK